MFEGLLILAAFLCSLVAGFLFAFAVVAMPGLAGLSDREFLRAFQVMDRVIQDNQPIFMAVWIGSVLSLVVATVVGIGRLSGVDLWLLIAAALAYLFGVQLPTAARNIPLNNRLQAVDVAALDEAGGEASRREFEASWNRWNELRTGFAGLASALLLILLYRL